MKAYRTELGQVIFNPTSRCYEALVSFHEDGDIERIPCALAFPMDAEPRVVAAALIRQAQEILRELGLDQALMVAAVAKGPERRPGQELLIDDAHPAGQRLTPDLPASTLVQQIRDEAHRFAITGHRGRRAKARTRSTLEDIPGIGARKRAALLKHFGGLRGVASAGVEELCAVSGINQELAQRIYDALH